MIRNNSCVHRSSWYKKGWRWFEGKKDEHARVRDAATSIEIRCRPYWNWSFSVPRMPSYLNSDQVLRWQAVILPGGGLERTSVSVILFIIKIIVPMRFAFWEQRRYSGHGFHIPRRQIDEANVWICKFQARMDYCYAVLFAMFSDLSSLVFPKSFQRFPLEASIT